MVVRVFLFARLAEAAGARSVELSFTSPPVTVEMIRNRLVQLYPDSQPLIEASLVAVNQQYAAAGSEVSPADEVALIPPVSGG